MNCPECRIENPDYNRFCRECGAALRLICTRCGSEMQIGDKFCGKCGQKVVNEAKENATQLTSEGERKHVTVLFSDISGYTAMSEMLDPEVVKEITGRIYGESSKIIAKYGGFVEKFAGDAVMALFGADKSHEDDPVRALRAANEIHGMVESLSPRHEEKIGRPLQMHSGINTGLVVTGELNLEKGVHGVTGDTINVAARLSSTANAGEILVDHETYTRSEGYFQFENLEPVQLKGKSTAVQVHRYLAVRDQTQKVHRLHGVRAELIGRKAEMAQLAEAVENLKHGKGAVFSIIGAAGTGKSRLVEEFKSTLDLEEIQWRIGHAFPYSQRIPYFPLIDLINRTLQIEEGDSPEKIRDKIESRIKFLLGDKQDIAPYIGSLYSLSYPEIENVSPEYWKSELQKGMYTIFSELARRGPTIICLEDLHWADSSSLDLVRFLVSEIREPILFISVYRPIIKVFSRHQISSLPHFYLEIILQDLSRADSQQMVQSLLKSEKIPSDLEKLIREKVEGNPFYLEEIINSLIESDHLIQDNGRWQVAKQIHQVDISSTIQGVISARVDRLEQDTKRILQEASVIGRSFYYEILNKISKIQGGIDQGLHRLERLDLIKAKSIQPELEYFFKHSLTQEVVYNGLLKKERRKIHISIAQVIEQLFPSRLPEFYETLAYHFKMARSTHQAIEYLMKSGAKCIAKYAVDESNQHYSDAYQLLEEITDKTKSDKELLINLLLSWALVLYYRGDFARLTELFEKHLDLARNLDDQSTYGMFYAWLGFALLCRNRIKDSYEYLRGALDIGEQLEDQKLIGYCCAWLPWTCAYYGLLDEAIDYGKRAQEISKAYPSDPYIYFKSLGGMALATYLKGDKKTLFELGKMLVDFGCSNSNVRSHSMGQGFIGGAYALEGNLAAAVEKGEKGVSIAADPFYAEYGRNMLGRFYLLNSQLDAAETAFRRTLEFGGALGIETMEAPSRIFLGVIEIARGRMNQGLKLLRKGQQECKEGQEVCEHCLSEHLLGKVYLQMVQKKGPLGIVNAVRNIGFLVKNIPVASKKAEQHLAKAIETAKRIGAESILGPAYLDLGYLHRAKKKIDKAKECFNSAIQIFEKCEMDGFLKQAMEAMESL